MFLGVGVGDWLSIVVCLLGVIGGVLNTEPSATRRYYSFIIWTAANGLGTVLNAMAYLGIITLTLGFALFAVLNLIYAVIDVRGIFTALEEMRDGVRRCKRIEE